MQYKSKSMDAYISKYVSALRSIQERRI